MAISAAIVDGKIYAKSTPDNLSQDTKGTSTMGKDQFKSYHVQHGWQNKRIYRGHSIIAPIFREYPQKG